MTDTATAPEAPDTTQLTTRSTGADIAFGISAVNWEHAYKMAKVIADSEMIPKQYRGRPADVVVAMQHGAEVGLPPMAALQSIAVINGRPGLYGDGFLAVIMASPRYDRHEEYYVTAHGEHVEHLSVRDLTEDETKAVSKFWRRGVATPFTGTFSIADAKKANLWKKDGPWQEYPQRQLLWRARGYAGRNGFAAELRGMVITAELHDIPAEPEEQRVIEMPQRRSEKPDPEPAPEPDPREPAPPSPSPGPAAPPAKPAKGKPAPSKKPDATAGDTQVYEAMVITETNYIEKDGEGYYKIEAKKQNAPLAFDFITRDQAVGAFAESAAGSPQTFKLTYRPWKRPDKPIVKELVEIVAS
jgi:hypothetical protein